MMKLLLVFAIFLVATTRGAPTYGVVTPVILPKVHVSSPEVTVVKQPYVIHQTEPVFRQYYHYAADPLPLSPVPYAAVPHHAVAYHHDPTAVVYQTVTGVNYAV